MTRPIYICLIFFGLLFVLPPHSDSSMLLKSGFYLYLIGRYAFQWNIAIDSTLVLKVSFAFIPVSDGYHSIWQRYSSG